MLGDRIDSNLEIEAEDIGYAPFNQRGGLRRVHQTLWGKAVKRERGVKQRVGGVNRSADTPQPKSEWRILPFEVAAVPQSDRGKRVKQRDYLPAGRIPVVDQGQAQIGGYPNNEEFAFG